MAKKALGSLEARKRWCKCCDELTIMLEEEVKNNPRYNINMNWNNEPPSSSS
jgi:hypothetical protein